MTMRLYQSRFFTPPEVAPPEEITEDKWHHNHSQPVRNQTATKAACYMVAALAGCVLTPIAYPGNGDAIAATSQTSMRFDRSIVYQDLAYTPSPQANDAIGWHQPFSQPRKPGRVPEYPDFAYTPYVVAAALAEDATVAESSTIVRHRKTIIYDDVISAPYVQAETITLDKWVGQVEQPTRRKTFLQGAAVIAPTQPQANDGIGWHRPLSEPTRRKTFLEADIAFSPTQASHNDGIGWHRPFSEPTRRKVFLEADIAFSPSQPEASDVSWRQPLSTPLRARAPVAWQQDLISGPELPITTTLEYAWHRPLSEPTRVKVRQNEGSFVYPYQTIVTGAAGDGAFIPAVITTSVRHDKTIIFDDYAQAPYTPAVTSAEEIIVASSNTVVRSRKTIIYDDIVTAPYVVAQEVVTSDKWFSPFSQPTRRKVFAEADTAYSPTLVEDAAIQAKWFQPFGTPRAAKRPPEFPASFYSPYFVPPEYGIGTEFNWWPNLSERIRRHTLGPDKQQAVIQGPQYPITVTLEYVYARPWSEPTVRVVSRQAPLPYTPYQAEVVTLDKYYVEFGRPTLAKPRLEGENVLAPFQVIGPDSWGQPLDEPTRRKVFLEGEYAFDPFPQVSGPDRWWQAFSTPLRRKVSAAFHPEPVQPNFVPAPSYGWYVPLSDPTRRIVFRSIHRPYFGVEIDFTPSVVACSHTTLLFPSATVTVVFGTAETAELSPSAETTVLYPEADTEVDWPTATVNITECED